MRTPPHYSDLQLIELVWTQIKGCIVRQYSKNTTLEDVKIRLYTGFDKLESEEGNLRVSKIVDRVDKLITQFISEVEQEEQEDQKERTKRKNARRWNQK